MRCDAAFLFEIRVFPLHFANANLLADHVCTQKKGRSTPSITPVVQSRVTVSQLM
jgi:hypothetical protein